MWRSAVEKTNLVLHLIKLVDIMLEFTAFTLNQTNITSQSEVVAFINTRRKIVSRAAVLMNGEEVSGSRAQCAEKDITLAHIYIEKLFKRAL